MKTNAPLLSALTLGQEFFGLLWQHRCFLYLFCLVLHMVRETFDVVAAELSVHCKLAIAGLLLLSGTLHALTVARHKSPSRLAFHLSLMVPMLLPSLLKTCSSAFYAVWRPGTYALAQTLNLRPSLALYIVLELCHGIAGTTEPATVFLACYVALCMTAMSECLRQKKARHKFMAAEYIQTLKEKTDKLSIKNKFIATITHEIRNFVSNIVTNSSFLKESGMWNEEVVNELAQASSFLAEILNNTLDISKLEEGKVEFNNSYESIRSVIDVVLSVCKANAGKKDIKLDVVYCNNLPDLLEFDRSRLTQIIMNLVGNAIKFTPERGKVTVKVDWTEPESPAKSKAPAADKFSAVETEAMQDIQEASKEEEKEKDREKQRRFTIQESGEELVQSPGSTEQVPDESSPTGDTGEGPKTDRIYPRKIVGKIMSHLFVVKPHARALSGIIGNSEDATRNVTLETQSQGNSATPIATTPDCAPDSARLGKRTVGPPCRTKQRSTFCLLPTAEKDQESDCLPKTTRHAKPDINYALVKLRKVAKEFRMSQKCMTKPEHEVKFRSPVPKEKVRTPVNRKKQPIKSFSMCDSPSSSRRVETKDKGDKGVLTIEVIDTGCGMSEAEKEKLFQPFSQANKSVHSKFGGTGLGLWLCHKLISAMDGSITCTSEINKGTTFKLTLSVKAKSKTSDSSTLLAQTMATFKGFTVLCYLKNAEEVEGPLRKTGCTLLAFSTFDDLLKTLRENKNQRIRRQAIITGMKGARLLEKQSRVESLGIKFSQVIVTTRKLFSEDEAFYQYILARPVNQYYLLNILVHIINGQTLCNEGASPSPSPTKAAARTVSPFLRNEEPLGSILVVDDNEFCRKAMIRLLSKYEKEAEVTGCQNGVEALDLVTKDGPKFGLAIVDYQMPKMDGLVLTRELRAYEQRTGAKRPMPILCI